MSPHSSWVDDDPALADLYAIGMPMSAIASRLGRGKPAVKLRVFTRDLVRDPGRFDEYAELIALPGERWARVRFAPNYFVSNTGRVLSMTPSGMGNLMRPEIDKDGYPRVNLTVAGRRKHHHVHRLVGIHHVVGETPGFQVAHWDGVKSNCAASNLRWATPAGNHADKRRHGTLPRGETHPLARHTETEIAACRAGFARGETTRQAALAAGVSINAARALRRGKTWRHVPDQGVAT